MTALRTTTAAAPARAATIPVWSYPKTPILNARSLHIVNRFTGGWTPAMRTQVVAAGGIDAWFAGQLNPAPDTFYSASALWWPSNVADALTTVARQDAGTESFGDAARNYERWSLVRRIHGQRQVAEAMASFWEHHFHVPATGEVQAPFRAHYGRMIRSMALGRFDQLLNAISTHPAMGAYLGNARSTKRNPNENQGRELLELHTVGRSAGYTEDDVKNSARILTGWRVDTWGTWVAAYNTSSHWTGPVQVLGFSHPNTDPDGRAVTKAYLDYLARHPATARRIARKLAVRFVSDNPSNALVEHLATVYLANNTAIAPVLKALVATSEFAGSTLKKVRTPEEDIVATYRALGIKIAAPHDDQDAANAMLWQCSQIGLMPLVWPRPDGRPDTAADWSSVARMLGSFGIHRNLSGGWWPKTGLSYRTPASWLPQPSIRFDRFVDHLSRKILGRPSYQLLRTAAAQATGISGSTIITRDHGLIRWQMPDLLTVFLDNPWHLGR